MIISEKCHLPKFTCTTQVTVYNVRHISAALYIYMYVCVRVCVYIYIYIYIYQISWRNLWTRVLSQGFLHKLLWFDRLSESVMLFHTQREYWANTFSVWSPLKNCHSHNDDTKVKVCSPDGDTHFFDIVARVLQGHTLTPYLFIICLNYKLQTSVDLIKENGFKLKGKKQIIPHRNYYRCRLLQIHLPKPNPCYIVWSRQQEAIASMWMQTK